MPKKIEYVTAVEAARLTGLSERTIRRKISAGVLKAEKCGAHYAIRVGDLAPLTERAPTTLDTALMRIDELEAEQARQAERLAVLEQRIAEAGYRAGPAGPLLPRSLSQFAPQPTAPLACVVSGDRSGVDLPRSM